MNVNAAQRYRPSFGNFTFNTKFSLLGIGVLVIRLTAEQYTQRRNRSGMRDIDAELREVGRRDAGSVAGGGCGALDFALGKQVCKYASRVKDIARANTRRRRPRGIERDKRLRNLAIAIDQTERLHYVSNLSVDWRVEDAIARADDGLMVLERVPGKGETRSKVVLVCGQCPILRIHFIAHAGIQSEIGRHLPLVLHESGGEGTRIVVD